MFHHNSLKRKKAVEFPLSLHSIYYFVHGGWGRGRGRGTVSGITAGSMLKDVTEIIQLSLHNKSMKLVLTYPFYRQTEAQKTFLKMFTVAWLLGCGTGY
jgi:hypothetical protein